MAEGDTSLHRGSPMFPSTCWSQLLRSAAGGEGLAVPYMERLAASYWRPVYAFIRIRRARSNDDAKDLTQAFFASLVNGAVLSRYQPDRAAFRYYLKGVLRNFLLKQETARRALKRGGGHDPLPYAALENEENALPASKGESPEEAFDRRFVGDLLDAALERTKARCEAAGELEKFRVFELYELTAGERRTYGSIAEELGLSTPVVRHRLSAAREQIRVELRTLLRETVSTPEQFEIEWAELFETSSNR
jgi:RNA polymerase sigma factor (sigma-70 family)